MTLAAKLHVAAMALMCTPLVTAQTTLGALLDANATKVSPSEFKEELVQRTIVGLSPTGQRLEQVVTNLLSNASKYSHDEGAIFVTVTAGAADVVVRVRDEGVGLEPGMAARISGPVRRGAVAMKIGIDRRGVAIQRAWRGGGS